MSKAFEFNKVFKPYEYPWAVELWDLHETMHWTYQEVDLSEDIYDFQNKLTPKEKNHITQILRLFTQSDVAVGKNYYDFLIPVFKNNEIRNMLGGFANREGTHQAAYALLNESLGLPDSDWSAFLEYKEMCDKMDFMMDNSNTSYENISLTLAKSVFTEGVSLFASFAMLLNYQRFGKMKGMNTVVNWSIKDENMHVEGISKLFKVVCEEHPRIVNDNLKKKIYDFSRIVVELEDKFIDLVYERGEIKGLKSIEVKQYIRYMADRRLNQLGLKENFEIKENPLPWIDGIVGGSSFSNFFETRVTDYNTASLVGNFKTAWKDIYKN